MGRVVVYREIAFRCDRESSSGQLLRRSLGTFGGTGGLDCAKQLDAQAENLLPVTSGLSLGLLERSKAPVTRLACGLVPLDIDVFTQDNGRTKKDIVSRTYAGTDGFAPIAAYLGQEGWCLALELREESFSSRETEYTLERVLPRAEALTDAGILLRRDSGFLGERGWPWKSRLLRWPAKPPVANRSTFP